MKRRMLSLLLAFVMLLGILPTSSLAASTPEDALGEVDIYNGGFQMAFLSINGAIRKQEYTYFNYTGADGTPREVPAYCVNPNVYGVPQTVAPGESIKYIANEKASDPKVVGIISNGYPHRSLSELKLDNKYQAYYATKMALWCYLIPSWSINNLKVAPGLTGSELDIGNRVLASAKDIYKRGTTYNYMLTPKLTATPDKSTAYPVTIDGKAYSQQVFTLWSETWVFDYDISVAFSDPSSVPAGARIVDMDNRDITSITTEATGDGYAGKCKVLYPAESIQGETGSAQLSFTASVARYAAMYAICAETDKYGQLQNYICDTDNNVLLEVAAISNYYDEAEDVPEETSLKIIKLEEGTEYPLKGAVFSVHDPEGKKVGSYSTGPSGTVTIPLTLEGHYTVTEEIPPQYHLLPDTATQHVDVEYGKVAEVTFWNAPYGDLRVQKMSDTGDALSGVTVQIKRIESGETLTGKTLYGGAVVFAQLKPGAYEVKEVSGIPGWAADTDTVQTVTVLPGKTSDVTIINQELPGLRIIKYDRKNQVAMSNVTFEVFKDTVSLGKFRTDEFGEILLTNLEPGTYLACEVDTGSNEHILDTTPQQVELNAGDGIKELLFFNDVKPGLRLVKVDSTDPSKVIPNAVFEIKSVAGDYGPQEFTTDENGEIDLSKLPAGAYVVTEISCPGYVIDQAQRIIQLDPNEDAHFVFTNSIKPSLQLIKTSSDGSRLAGVTYRITKIEDGSHYLDRTTNAQGEIIIADLEPGVYSVKETATVTDHILDPQEHHVELFPGQTSTIVLQNYKRPNLTVYKHDADTGDPIPGTIFSVRAADGHSVNEIKTDSQGKATLTDLLPGVYEISERSVPAPWLMDAKPQLVTLYPNRDHTVYFENHKKPNLTVNKVDSITGSPIKGAKFEVWYGSNNTTTGELNSLGTFYSDANGQFFIDSLRDGWYKVTELEPAAGYTIKQPATQEFYIKGGESKVITFENVPIGGLTIIKKDEETGERISGVQFEIRKLNGEIIGTYTTDRSGVISLPEAEKGWYQVTELKAAKGYQLDSQPYQIEVKEGGTATLEITNRQTGSAIIHKIDSVTGQGIFGVKFLLSDAKGNPIGTYESDNEGYVYIDKELEDGRYTIREIECAEGYILDTQPKTVYVEYGGCTTITWKNTAVTGQIQITKTSADYNSMNGWPAGAPIPGTVFEIYHYRTGNLVDTIRTDKNGVAVSKPLPLGRYKVVESQAADFYVLDKTPIDVEIEHAGQIVKAAMTNKSLSTNVSIQKTGYAEVMPGHNIRYTFSGIANNSTTALTSFYWKDTLPVEAVRLARITTGTYNAAGSYKIVYKTNLSGADYRVLADSLSTQQSYVLEASPVALRLASNEYVTQVMFVFGVVPANFRQVEAPMLDCSVVSWATGGSQFVNQADVGGVYNGQWIMATSRWITKVYAPSKPLPRTGY